VRWDSFVVLVVVGIVGAAIGVWRLAHRDLVAA
jgi:hypothetical protein